MRRVLVVLGLIPLMMIVAAAPALAERLPGSNHGGLRLTADMTGAQEVPGPGDADGTGTAVITLNPGQDEVCWSLTAADITLPASAAHIHRGPAGVAGPVVVGLSPPGSDGTSGGCATVDGDLLDAIKANPAGFYVNVHTSDFPAGAIRGQLGQ